MGLGTALNRYSILFIVLLLAGNRGGLCRNTHRRRTAVFPENRTSFSTDPVHAGAAFCLPLCQWYGYLPEKRSTQEQSLELTERLIEDTDFCKKLEACRDGLSEGQDLAALLHQEQILTGVYARMASIGARTGELDAVLERIADLCQEDLDDRMNRTLAVLEPTLVITLSLIVGVILLSAMLPLMGILSSL